MGRLKVVPTATEDFKKWTHKQKYIQGMHKICGGLW